MRTEVITVSDLAKARFLYRRNVEIDYMFAIRS